MTSRTDRHSQTGIVNTVKDWLTPNVVKQVKKNQARQKANIKKETGQTADKNY